MRYPSSHSYTRAHVAGGQLCVSAHAHEGPKATTDAAAGRLNQPPHPGGASAVQLVVCHTGRLALERMHPASAGLAAAPRQRRATRAPLDAPGSGLLSFTMAEELAAAVGGHVSVVHPAPMVNARSGNVDTATRIEVLLPAA